jgi:hypothetical protein
VHAAGRLIASTFAITGFIVALIAGAAAGNTALVTLYHAVVALIVCRIVGVVAASVLSRVAHSHVATYKASHPIPEVLTPVVSEETPAP